MRFNKLIRKFLYKVLPLEKYLLVLSKMYFFSFDLGLLRKNRVYDYPYFLKNILKKGDVCMDIGANLGYITVVLARIVGQEGQVHAIEPVAPVRSVLQKNTRTLRNVQIYPYALGEENKMITLGNESLDKKGYLASGSHFVLPDSANAQVEFNAEMRKGSELFSHLDRLDFIKCDVEGYDLIVLQELKPIIEKCLPMVQVECRGEPRTQINKYFQDLGYCSYVLENEKLIPGEKDDFWDLLLVPRSKISKIETYVTTQ